MTLIKKVMKQVLDQTHVVVWCETCNVVFLNMSYTEFLQKHSWNLRQRPDRWFLDAGLHFCGDPTHRIMSNLAKDHLGTPFCLSDHWKHDISLGKSSVPHMQNYLLGRLKELEEAGYTGI